MYNPEIKSRFLENYENRRIVSIFTVLFDSFEAAERRFSKDLAEFDKKEVLYAFEHSGVEDFRTVQTQVTKGREYTRWCIDNGIFVSIPRGFFDVSSTEVDLTGTLRGILFKNEDDLIREIQKVYTFDEGFIMPPVYILGWYGLTRQEILALRDFQVDLELLRVYNAQREIIVPRLSVSAGNILRRYVNCQISTRMNGTVLCRVYKDTSTGFFLKRMLTENSKMYGREYNLMQLDSQIGLAVEKYTDLGFPHRLTFSNVWRSGRFYTLWEKEQEGADINNKKLVESVFRNSKSYYAAKRMYGFYKKAFYT